jgi:Uma2 family endonuclease
VGTVTLSYQEWLHAPSPDCGTDEVVNGELRLVPMRLYPHAEVISRVLRGFRALPEDAVILGSSLGLMISREPLTCRSPDVVVYALKNMVVQDGLHWSPPGLIIEILSPSENRRRKEEKLADYAAIGLPEVWLVSPEAGTVEVRLLHAGKLERTAIVADGSLQPTEFPGVAVSARDIFPE